MLPQSVFGVLHDQSPVVRTSFAFPVSFWFWFSVFLVPSPQNPAVFTIYLLTCFWFCIVRGDYGNMEEVTIRVFLKLAGFFGGTLLKGRLPVFLFQWFFKFSGFHIFPRLCLQKRWLLCSPFDTEHFCLLHNGLEFLVLKWIQRWPVWNEATSLAASFVSPVYSGKW